MFLHRQESVKDKATAREEGANGEKVNTAENRWEGKEAKNKHNIHEIKHYRCLLWESCNLVCVCGGGVNGLKVQFLHKMNVVVDSFIYSMY